MTEILTGADVIHLSTIVDAASRSAKVRWLDTDKETIREGTARHIVAGEDPSQWYFVGSKQDIRDSFLRITTTTGWDTTVPVRWLMAMVAEGGFAVDS